MRFRRLLSLAWLALSAAAWLAVAGPAVACSCVETTTDDYVGDPSYAIFTGSALPKENASVPFVVDQWFQGAAPAPGLLLYTGEIPQADGVSMFDTCGRTLAPGAWLVFAARRDDGRYDPGGCTPTASLEEADGQARLAEVRAALTGVPPPTEAATPPRADAPDTPASDGPTLLFVAAPILIGGALFLLLVLGARRRA